MVKYVVTYDLQSKNAELLEVTDDGEELVVRSGDYEEMITIGVLLQDEFGVAEDETVIEMGEHHHET